MESRTVYTKMWRDEWFGNLSRAGKLLFVYCITNTAINQTGIYDNPDKVISFETGLNSQELEDCKKELFPKVLFYRGWVKVLNAQRYSNFKGESNQKAQEKEMSCVPEEILCYFNDLDTLPTPSIQGEGSTNPLYSNLIKSNPIQKPSFSKLSSITPEVVQDIASVYKIPVKFVEDKLEDLRLYCGSKGKTYKDYKDTLMNWCRRDWEKSKSRYRELPKVEIVETHEMTDEQRLQAIRNLELAKNSFKKIGGGDSK